MQSAFDTTLHAAPLPLWACVAALIQAVLIGVSLTLIALT